MLVSTVSPIIGLRNSTLFGLRCAFSVLNHCLGAHVFLFIDMINKKILECGITLITEKIPEMQAASIGVYIGAGSAYENPEISGISHFIEHMFFKGTKNRTYKEIAEQMDNLGAQYNACTSKEYTCYYAKSITSAFQQVCDILFDMLTNSLFDEKEMNKERKVILEEMSMITDTPDDYVIDLLTENTMYGTDVANSIIGTRKSLKNIGHNEIVDYIKNQYVKDHIVVAVVGSFKEKELINQINNSFSSFAKKKTNRKACLPSVIPKYTSKVRDVNQSHIALGVPSISMGDKSYYAQAVVNDVLGGSMSSRLFQNIREEKGLAYSVYSAPITYQNNGFFLIYAGVSLGKESDAINGIADELKRLEISIEELENVKQRLKANYIFSLERLENRMMRLGKQSLLLDRVYTDSQTMKEINAVTLDDVKVFCEKFSDIKKYSGAIISRNKIDLKRIING